MQNAYNGGSCIVSFFTVQLISVVDNSLSYILVKFFHENFAICIISFSKTKQCLPLFIMPSKIDRLVIKVAMMPMVVWKPRSQWWYTQKYWHMHVHNNIYLNRDVWGQGYNAFLLIFWRCRGNDLLVLEYFFMSDA